MVDGFEAQRSFQPSRETIACRFVLAPFRAICRRKMLAGVTRSRSRGDDGSPSGIGVVMRLPASTAESYTGPRGRSNLILWDLKSLPMPQMRIDSRRHVASPGENVLRRVPLFRRWHGPGLRRLLFGPRRRVPSICGASSACVRLRARAYPLRTVKRHFAPGFMAPATVRRIACGCPMGSSALPSRPKAPSHRHIAASTGSLKEKSRASASNHVTITPAATP
jgi:hypothetical protein